MHIDSQAAQHDTNVMLLCSTVHMPMALNLNLHSNLEC
jgi:hypothetical protein